MRELPIRCPRQCVEKVEVVKMGLLLGELAPAQQARSPPYSDSVKALLRQPLLRLYQGTAKPLSRSSKARLRRYEGAMMTLLRCCQGTMASVLRQQPGACEQPLLPK